MVSFIVWYPPAIFKKGGGGEGGGEGKEIQKIGIMEVSLNIFL